MSVRVYEPIPWWRCLGWLGDIQKGNDRHCESSSLRAFQLDAPVADHAHHADWSLHEDHVLGVAHQREETLRILYLEVTDFAKAVPGWPSPYKVSGLTTGLIYTTASYLTSPSSHWLLSYRQVLRHTGFHRWKRDPLRSYPPHPPALLYKFR